MEESFSIGDKVWVKWNAFFYPGQIMDPAASTVKPTSKKPYLVYFYGTCNFSLQSAKELVPYQSGFEKHSQTKKQAILDAIKEVDDPLRQPSVVLKPKEDKKRKAVDQAGKKKPNKLKKSTAVTADTESDDEVPLDKIGVRRASTDKAPDSDTDNEGSDDETSAAKKQARAEKKEQKRLKKLAKKEAKKEAKREAKKEAKQKDTEDGKMASVPENVENLNLGPSLATDSSKPSSAHLEDAEEDDDDEEDDEEWAAKAVNPPRKRVGVPKKVAKPLDDGDNSTPAPVKSELSEEEIAAEKKKRELAKEQKKKGEVGEENRGKTQAKAIRETK